MIYADKCFWYFDQQRAYETLEAWTLAGLDAAERLPDPAMRGKLGLNAGITYERQRNWPEAERYYREVYEGDLRSDADADTRASACYGLGIIHRQRGQLDAAEGYYRKVYEGDLSSGAAADTRARACYGLGIVHWQRGELEAAHSYYTQAIQLDPQSAAAYRNRGLVHEQLGKLEEALEDAKTALALDPTFAAAQQDIQRYEGKLQTAAQPANNTAEGAQSGGKESPAVDEGEEPNAGRDSSSSDGAP
jgi:tetratricopeptide (TPR) repeat protein